MARRLHVPTTLLVSGVTITSVFLALMIYSKGVVEGAFDKCGFENEEEALAVAKREFEHYARSSNELRGRIFAGTVEQFGKNPQGNLSAVIVFRSEDPPFEYRQMYLTDDCTQAISLPNN